MNKIPTVVNGVDVDSQLDFFKVVSQENRNYSQSIIFYDSMPKYDWRHKREYEITPENSLQEKEFFYRGQRFICTVTPAVIKRQDGSTVYVYPSKREELVEDALRKLAVDGRVKAFQEAGSVDIGLQFTLYELREELARVGHTLDINTIRESCLVMAKSNIDCVDEAGTGIISGNFLSGLGLTTAKDWETSGKAKRCFARFNHLVSAAILEGKTRPYNYLRAMQIKDSFAKYLYKRMCALYVQAHTSNSFNILLTTAYRDSGRELSTRMPNNVRAIETALNALKEGGHIDRWDAEYRRQGKVKILDVLYKLYPSSSFVKDTIAANAIVKDIPGEISE